MTSTRTTIADIARLAGVSKATVSYVLNSRRSGFNISEETSRRILALCQVHNYRPDRAAVLLSECRKTPLQLLVASPWLYAQFSDFMVQLNLVLHEHERSSRMAVSYVSFSVGELREALKPSVLKRYDAVLVVGTGSKDAEWLEKHAEELPKVVLMNRQVPGILSCCGNDEKAVAGVAKAVDFSSYDRFAVMIPPRHSFCEVLRCRGFSAACAAKKLPVEEFNMSNYSCLWEMLSPELEKAGRLLVFCPQYVPAALLLKEARGAGIGIPEKLGIIAYDRHSLLDQFCSPKLTSIDPHLSLMAEKTLELIFGVRDGRKQQSQTVKAEILTGGTTVNKIKKGKEK